MLSAKALVAVLPFVCLTTAIIVGPPDCTPTPTPAPNPKFVCGQQGTVSRPALIDRFQSCSGDEIGCYDVCAMNSACISFAYNQPSNMCATFSTQVIRQSFRKNQSSGTFFWNIRHCYKKPSCSGSTCRDERLLVAKDLSVGDGFPGPFPDNTCGNAGVDYAIYTNDHGNQTVGDQWTFHGEQYKETAPLSIGTTTRIASIPAYGTDEDTVSIYDSRAPARNVMVNHHTYFVPWATGTYTFNFRNTDDYAGLWLGHFALDGWNCQTANAELAAEYGVTKSVTKNLVAGAFVPMRIVWAQSEGPGNLAFELVGPDGVVAAAGDVEESPYFVRFSCDRSKAPGFKPFGREADDVAPDFSEELKRSRS